MAQTITAAALLKAQSRIAEAYAGDTPSKYPFNEPAMSAAALLMENSSFTQSAFTEDGNYRGKEINWIQAGSTTITNNTTPDSATQTCDLSSTVGATSAAKLYSNNMLISAEVEVTDDTYGSVLNTEDLIDNRFMKAMRDIRNALNTKVVNFLDSNKTPINNDSNLPDAITFNGTSDIYEVDTTAIDLQSPDGLTDLDALAMNNDMAEWFYLTGRHNFYNNIVDAQYRQLNDNQRHLARFFDPAYNIYTDPRSLDATLTGKNTFVVGNGTYALWDYIHPGKSTVPVQVSADKWEYMITDPVLMINENGVLRPLRYNVYYTRECTSVNKNVGNRTFLHKWEISLLGGLHEAPASEDTHTGILRVQGVGV